MRARLDQLATVQWAPVALIALISILCSCGPAQCRPLVWIAAAGNIGSSDFSDLTERGIEEPTRSFSYDLAVGLQRGDSWRLGVGYSRWLSDGGTEYPMHADFYWGLVQYPLMSGPVYGLAGELRAGWFFTTGPWVATTEDTIYGPGIRANGPHVRLSLIARRPAADWLEVQALVGYQYSQSGELQQHGGGAFWPGTADELRVSYSGVILSFGLTLLFSGSTG